jgi:hypothetical protein
MTGVDWVSVVTPSAGSSSQCGVGWEGNKGVTFEEVP